MVATFSMKSAIHVYKFNHANVTVFASGKEGDNCWDKDAFLHLGPIEYLNGRLSILALGVLPAAAWSAMQILKWCAGDFEDEQHSRELKRDNYFKKMEQPEETGEDPLGLGKCLKCCPQTIHFSNVSFQTTIGVSLFNLLGVFALIMDSFAVKQWDMGSCKADIAKLNDENGNEMYDPSMPGFDFKNLPWLLMCTNLLAFAMGIVTLTIACTHLSRHIDRHYDRNGEKYYEKLQNIWKTMEMLMDCCNIYTRHMSTSNTTKFHNHKASSSPRCTTWAATGRSTPPGPSEYINTPPGSCFGKDAQQQGLLYICPSHHGRGGGDRDWRHPKKRAASAARASPRLLSPPTT